MIALSLGLKNIGHDVLLIGPPEKKQWAQQLGCPYKGLGRDVTAFLDTIKKRISLEDASQNATPNFALGTAHTMASWISSTVLIKWNF
jgi:hypothetical protein